MTGMCPHCGELFPISDRDLVPIHYDLRPVRVVCPGTGQIWRNPQSDARPLWSGEPNPNMHQASGSR